MKKLLLSCAAVAIATTGFAATEVTFSTAETTPYRIDAGSARETMYECDLNTFFAVIESDSDPVVALDCANIGTNAAPFLNDMIGAVPSDKSESEWYYLYGGNGGPNEPEYQIHVPDGYVITNVSARLVSYEGVNIDWYFSEKSFLTEADGIVYEGEKFTSSMTGRAVNFDCNSQYVYITTDLGEVKPTEFMDLVVTVAKEGEEPGDEPASGVANILGKYTVDYYVLENNQWSTRTVDDVTISQVEGNDVAISANIFASIIPNLKPIPATYYPEDNTLVIVFGDIDSDWIVEGERDWGDGDDEWEDATEIVFQIDEDGTIYSDTDDEWYYWLIFNPATSWLDYAFMEVTFTLVERTGVESIQGAEIDANAPVVYYDLQGRKVNNPSKGMFIRKQGNKASKVVIR